MDRNRLLRWLVLTAAWIVFLAALLGAIFFIHPKQTLQPPGCTERQVACDPP